jgi:hypothetical protein
VTRNTVSAQKLLIIALVLVVIFVITVGIGG